MLILYDVHHVCKENCQETFVKRTFPEHRFPNEFPNENTPEIRVISGA